MSSPVPPELEDIFEHRDAILHDDVGAEFLLELPTDADVALLPELEAAADRPIELRLYHFVVVLRHEYLVVAERET